MNWETDTNVRDCSSNKGHSRIPDDTLQNPLFKAKSLCQPGKYDQQCRLQRPDVDQVNQPVCKCELLPNDKAGDHLLGEEVDRLGRLSDGASVYCDEVNQYCDGRVRQQSDEHEQILELEIGHPHDLDPGEEPEADEKGADGKLPP